MKRYRVWVAVLGVVGVPAVAAACWPMWRGPAYGRPVYSAPPMYAAPVYIAPPECYPAPGYVIPAPRIETTPKTATPGPAPAPGGMGGGTPAPKRAPAVEAIRPAGGSDAASPKPADPIKPAEKPAEKPIDPDSKFPEIVIPKNFQLPPDKPNPSKLPPLELPKVPAARPTLKAPAVDPAVPRPAPGGVDDSPIKLPPLELPKSPPVGPASPALPSAAPATPDPFIPSPSVPLVPESGKAEGLPSLTLPPESPVKPDSMSKSSPIADAAPTVSVFPVGGDERRAALGGGYKTVGFYNHTARDLNLTIEGRSVKLPAMNYLHAQLGPTFNWGYADKPAARETVPAGAPGVDVVFRAELADDRR